MATEAASCHSENVQQPSDLSSVATSKPLNTMHVSNQSSPLPTENLLERSIQKHGSIMRAASVGDIPVINAMLSRGISINSQDQYGWSALARYHKIVARSDFERACFKGHLGVVQLLLEQGANPNIEDLWGNVPLFWAAMFDRIGILELLLQHGADVMHTSRDGSTAVHVACRWQRERAAVLLTECGADVDEIDGEGRTPIQYAEIERLRVALEGAIVK